MDITMMEKLVLSNDYIGRRNHTFQINKESIAGQAKMKIHVDLDGCK